MTEYKEQRIRDPLHNIISFDCKSDFERMMWQIVQTPVFQRLRRIKQLGFSEFVYPGATHSRFSHCIGTFHLARRLVQVVDRHHDTPDQWRKQVALTAALIHDLGHGPFSHAFADVSKKLDLRIPEHELVSAEIVREHLGLVFEQELGQENGRKFRDDVATLLAQSMTRDIYSSVVSSQFDADRLDYMQRDRLMTGTRLGTVDFEWLINNLEIATVPYVMDNIKVGERPSFVVGHKAISAVESYVLNLFQLYPNVYYHKATRCVEKLFTKLMTLAIERLSNPHSRGKLNLPAQHPLVLFALKPKDIENIIALDDTVVWGCLSLMKDSKDKEIASLSRRLLDRKLLSCIDIRHIVEGHLIEKKIENAENSGEVRDDKFLDRLDMICDTIEAELLSERRENLLIDKDERSPYKNYQEDKGLLNQIRIRPSRDTAQTFDIAHWSKTVAAIEKFKFFRVYIEKEDDRTEKAILTLIEAIIGKEGAISGS